MKEISSACQERVDMSIVYVPANVRKKNVSGQWVNKYDLTMVEQEFGEISFILGNNVRVTRLSYLIPQIEENLSRYTLDDYILCLGSPALIATCVHIAMKNMGFVKMLQWDNQQRIYVPIILELHPLS